MIYECTLEIENNQCKYLSIDKKYCTAIDTECSFRKIKNVTQNHTNIKPEKWFEKY